MRRTALAVLLAATLACTTSVNAQTTDPASLARQTLDRLDAGEYALVEQSFAAQMAAAVPADKLKAYREARRAILAKYPVPRATIDDLVKHIVHAAQVAGKAHIGLSGDFDGGGGLDGFDDITDFPMLTEKLLAAGFTKEDLAGFWGGNALRALKQADEMKAK